MRIPPASRAHKVKHIVAPLNRHIDKSDRLANIDMINWSVASS